MMIVAITLRTKNNDLDDSSNKNSNKNKWITMKMM